MAPSSPEQALTVARKHYADGVAWLGQRGNNSTSAGAAMCAATATAHFAAGHLALLIAASEQEVRNGN